MKDILSSYYVVEDGKFNLYAYEEGILLLKYSSRSLAVAFNSDTLQFFKLGDSEMILSWASAQRKELRDAKKVFEAENLAVRILHPSHPVTEFNRLLESPSYLTIFLQKAGLI